MKASKPRLECAFVLADRPDIHRDDSGSSISSSGSSNDYVSKEDVMRPPACRMWESFGKYAEHQGYGIFHGIKDCDNRNSR